MEGVERAIVGLVEIEDTDGDARWNERWTEQQSTMAKKGMWTV